VTRSFTTAEGSCNVLVEILSTDAQLYKKSR